MLIAGWSRTERRARSACALPAGRKVAFSLSPPMLSAVLTVVCFAPACQDYPGVGYALRNRSRHWRKVFVALSR